MLLLLKKFAYVYIYYGDKITTVVILICTSLGFRVLSGKDYGVIWIIKQKDQGAIRVSIIDFLFEKLGLKLKMTQNSGGFTITKMQIVC